MRNAKSPTATPSKQEPEEVMCTAFEGHRRISSGALAEVVVRIKMAATRANHEPILVFDDRTGGLVEVDLRGTIEEVLARLERNQTALKNREYPPQQGPGRPRLGVIAREVTLLPAQWDWLDGQPGGASAALRRLVHLARRSSHEKDQARISQEAVYRFMTAMAGNFLGFEEALRSFYRRDSRSFEKIIAAWPKDIRGHLKKLVAIANRNQAAAKERKDAADSD
jgi:hypothetical protein